LDKTRDDPGFDSSDSDASEDIGRNVNASPIVQNKGEKKYFGRNNNAKYEPRMTEVVEETEPESSFKETDKFKKNKNKNDPYQQVA